MKFITKKRFNSGFFELLIVLPLFTGILCLIAGIGYILIKKTVLEKNAWTIQTQETYGINTGNIETYKIETGSYFQDFLEELLKHTTVGLPVAFEIDVLRSPTVDKKLTFQEDVPTVIPNLETATSDDSSLDMIRHIQLGSDFVVPGSDFKNGWILRNAIWAQDMQKAGFNYAFLQILGAPEIIQAAIPLSYLGVSLPSLFSGTSTP